jgi:hypothetical protein
MSLRGTNQGWGRVMPLVAALVVISAGPAGAAEPLERDHYVGSDPVKTFHCDSGDLLKNSEYWGSYSVRPSDDGQAALFHDTFKYFDTYTDATTGRFFTVSGVINLRDSEAHLLPQYLPARVYELRRELAVWAHIRVGDQTLMIHGAGRQVVSIVYNLDTNTVLSAEYTTAVGRLPWNDLSVNWCDMAVDLLDLA